MKLINSEVQKIADKLLLATLDSEEINLLTIREIEQLFELYSLLVFRKKFDIAYIELSED